MHSNPILIAGWTFFIGMGLAGGAAAQPAGPPEKPPLERIAADLTLNTTPQERSVKFSNKTSFLHAETKKVLSRTVMEMEALEKLGSENDLFSSEIFARKASFSKQLAGETLKPIDASLMHIGRMNLKHLINARGNVVSYGFAKITHKPAYVGAEATSMHYDVNLTYQSTFIGLPNRQMDPGDTWETKVRIISGHKGSSVDLLLTCTYEGSRALKEGPEASVKIAGKVNLIRETKRPLFRQHSDAVTGQAGFDVKRGFLTRVNLTLTDEFEYEELTLQRVIEMSLTRVPGNLWEKVKPGR